MAPAGLDQALLRLDLGWWHVDGLQQKRYILGEVAAGEAHRAYFVRASNICEWEVGVMA